jgi:hypothetical protein
MIKINKEILVAKLKKIQFEIHGFVVKKNKKRLKTFIGSFIDKLSYGKIAKYIFALLFGSALYYWALNPFKHGTDNENLTFLSSIYFSIITFSSLGYGDISPIGFGRLIASVEILSGLSMTAIFIGKIASEKQSVMMRLVYTSEHQKRLVKFEKQVCKLVKKIDNSLEEHNHEKLYLLSQTNYRFIASIHNYLKFQSNQADLATFGNATALKRLYKALIDLQLIMVESVKTFGTQPRTKSKTLQVINRVSIVANMMVQFHQDDEKIVGILHQIVSIENELKRWLEKFANGRVKNIYRSNETEKLLLKVLQAMPPKPWPRHIHKIIASDLEIQNQLAERCITILISEGKI